MDALLPYLLPPVYALAVVGGVMMIANYSVLAERKVASWIQGRVGPNRTSVPILSHIPLIGPFLTRLGFFQPLADGGKFLLKEEIMPGHVNKFYYVLAPLVALIPALTTVTVLPFGQIIDDAGQAAPLVLANLDIGILFIFAISSLGVYGIILAGWSANSKYPFLGGIRSSAQMISYELAMATSVLPLFMWMGGSLNLFELVQGQASFWSIFLPWQWLSALIFLTALFAETNRLPFDMPEAETELVGGYNTEYGAFKFGLFFVAEYCHIIIGSGVFVVLFLGGWHIPFVTYPEGLLGAAISVSVFLAKLFAMIFFFMWIRWTLPRFRYDQVMNLGWKVMLPIALANVVLNAFLIAAYESFNRG